MTDHEVALHILAALVGIVLGRALGLLLFLIYEYLRLRRYK